VLIKLRGFSAGQFNFVIQTFPQPATVAVIKNIFAFCPKILASVELDRGPPGRHYHAFHFYSYSTIYTFTFSSNVIHRK